MFGEIPVKLSDSGIFRAGPVEKGFVQSFLDVDHAQRDEQLALLLDISEELAVQIIDETDQRIIEIQEAEKRNKEDLPEEL